MTQKLILARKATVSADVVGVNNTDVAFEWTTDDNGDPIPVGCRITGISVIPHNAATPKVAVATVWRLRLYTKNTLLIEDMRYEDSRFGRGADSAPSFDKTEWQYHNDQKLGAINGTIGIEAAATDCSFRIAIDFERG